jgi:threonine dehydratase
MNDSAPSYADIVAAAARIRSHAVETPLLRSPALDGLTGGRILLKNETEQRTGSFKFRGALNRMSQIPAEVRKAGVVAYSSGNHAQAVAAVAKLLGMPACIVMPSDAPAVKIEKTRGYGAEVVLYDRVWDSREEIGGRIAAERGATIVPPFDDAQVIAGQGTCGLEIVAQARAQALTPDAVLVPCSGGGLTAGIAIAVKEHFPNCEIVTVEPVGFDDTSRSLAAGVRQTNERATGSICDALLVRTPGRITFGIMSRLVSRGLAIGDDDVLRAVAFAQKKLSLKVEPGGAIALAALIAGRYEAKDRTVVAVISGGNVDEAMLNRALLTAAEA